MVRRRKSSALGIRLREARKHLRLSQSAVARFLGTTRQTIAAYEQNLREPGFAHLIGLANLYRHTLDELAQPLSSAKPAAPVPVFQPRFNSVPRLTAHDRQELSSFAADLQHRPRTRGVRFNRPPIESITEMVKRWSRALRVKHEAPIPVFDLLARYGIEVRFTTLEQLSGALVMGDADHPHGVLVNSDQPYDRQRYSAAHEVAHLVLDHTAGNGAFISYLGRRFDPVELHADQFAAELLVPRDLLEQEFTRLPAEEPLSDQIYRLATAFRVSYQAMTVRLVRLGAISPLAGREVSRVRPTEIASRLRLAPRARQTRFNSAWLPDLVRRATPHDPQLHFKAHAVRDLQEVAYQDYVQRVPDPEQADDAGKVYEVVAVWVAGEYPLVAA